MLHRRTSGRSRSDISGFNSLGRLGEVILLLFRIQGVSQYLSQTTDMVADGLMIVTEKGRGKWNKVSYLEITSRCSITQAQVVSNLPILSEFG